MRKITSPAKRIDSDKLRAELLAVGVPLRPIPPGLPPQDVYISGDTLILVIAADDDRHDAIARQVLGAHDPGVELTPKQIRKSAAKRAMTDVEDVGQIATRAAIRVLYQSLVETRATINAIRQQLVAAGLPLTVQPLQNRTWEQALQAAEKQIDDEIDALQMAANRVGLS